MITLDIGGLEKAEAPGSHIDYLDGPVSGSDVKEVKTTTGQRGGSKSGSESLMRAIGNINKLQLLCRNTDLL